MEQIQFKIMAKIFKKRDKYVFVEYNGDMLACSKCIFQDGSDSVCERHACRPFERSDGKSGYYRLNDVDDDRFHEEHKELSL